MTPGIASALSEFPHIRGARAGLICAARDTLVREKPWNARTTMRRLPSLDTLRVFAVAARHLSFTKAAHELHLTQSAISHRVHALEDELGMPLFTRLTRRLELTRAGQSLAQRVGRAVGDIARAVAD